MNFGFEVTLLYSLYSDFIRKYGNYYIEDGTESGFIGTLSDLITEYLDSVLEEIREGTGNE